MPTARLPLNFDIKSRKNDDSKDSRLVNAYIEDGDIVKRPGLALRTLTGDTAADLPTNTPGVGQGIVVWDDRIIAVNGGEVYSIVGNTSTHLTTPAGMSSLPLSFTQTTGDNYLAFHDGTNVYTLQKDIGQVIDTLSGSAVESINVDNPSTNGWYGDDVTCTIASGSGLIVTANNHGLVAGTGVAFNTATGTIPAEITEYVTYQVAASPAPTTNTFALETTGLAAAAVTTTTASVAPVYYQASPVVTITGAGTAAGTARLSNHRVTAIDVNDIGSGASGATTVTVGAALAGTTATGTVNTTVVGVAGQKQVTSVSISSGGTRYLTEPTVTFSATSYPGYGPATGVAVLNGSGAVASVTITYAGLYSNNDSVTVTFSAPTQETALTSVATDATITGSWCPGFPYLDGYCFLLDEETGRIYNSALYDPGTWVAADYILATSEADEPVALARHLNYIVAFSKKGTEFFYNAGNPTESPLALNESAYLEIGCVSGFSVAHPEQSLIWLGEAASFGRSVYMLNGLSPIRVSTPHVEKYLNSLTNADIAPGQIRAFCIKIAGHTLYVLTMLGIEKTFVYDLDEKRWYQWTTQTGDTDGYDGVESYFAPVSVASNIEYASSDLAIYAQDNATGNLYSLSTDNYSCAGSHIYFRAVSPLIDSGSTKRKFYQRVEVVGDKIAGTLAIRHTDDDYITWSTRRTVDLSLTRPILYQNGTGRRRAWEVFCSDDVPIRLSALEIDFDIGEMGGGQEG